MDITLLFKACIKTVRTTNKTLGMKDTQTNILKTRTSDPNLKLAKEIVKQIKQLEEFLKENKLAYLNVINYTSTHKTMKGDEKENLDTMVEEIINQNKTLINKFREEIKKENKSSQKYEHYLSVLSSLDKYLKDVSKVYTQAKAIRVKRFVEAHKISRLEHKGSNQEDEKSELLNHTAKADTSKKSNFSNIVSSSPTEREENQLTVEEMQMFESENELLFNELNSLSDEVQQIESKVVHITELQELFTEKVLQQEKDVERIATTVAAASDNMKDANEQIRHAIQRNAGLRVWLLFFLLVMTFSLLFLDWYND